MFLIILFLLYDSLPPLPDLSKIAYPEPQLWIEPTDDYLILQGYTKDFYGAKIAAHLERLYLSTRYEHKNDWDSTILGNITTSYLIPLSQIWIQPGIDGFFLQRDDKYRLMTPHLDFSSSIPWVIIWGGLDYDLWQINKRNYIEEKAKLAIIFDQTPYMPHFEIAEIYTGKQIKPQITGKLHIHNFHVAVGSPILYGFPSPNLEIQYLEPKIKFETKLKSGLVYKTLSQFLDPETPIKYSIPVPDESLALGIDFGFTFDLCNHLSGFSSSYKNWNTRLIAGDGLKLVKVYDIQEACVLIKLKNSVDNKLFNIKNSFQAQYNWTDKRIPFLAQYSLLDTISANLGFFEISAVTEYLSKRDGIDKILPAMFIINPILGLRFKFLKLSLMTNNITNENEEIFDAYFLAQRQYAGSLEINYKF